MSPGLPVPAAAGGPDREDEPERAHSDAIRFGTTPADGGLFGMSPAASGAFSFTGAGSFSASACGSSFVLGGRLGGRPARYGSRSGRPPAAHGPLAGGATANGSFNLWSASPGPSGALVFGTSPLAPTLASRGPSTSGGGAAGGAHAYGTSPAITMPTGLWTIGKGGSGTGAGAGAGSGARSGGSLSQGAFGGGEEYEGSMEVGGEDLEWNLTLPYGPPPPGGYHVAIILNHGSTGDLATGQLPLYAAVAGGAGVPCLRFTCRAQDIESRISAMKEFMLRAGEIHPGLAAGPAGPRWVAGGHSLGARAALHVAADLCRRPSSEASAAGDDEAEGGDLAGDLEPSDLDEAIWAAGLHLAGVFLSSFAVHLPDTPDQIRYQPIGSLPASLPICLLRGTADPHTQPGPWALWKASLAGKDITITEIEGGDHWLRPPNSGEAQLIAGAWTLRNALRAFLIRMKAATGGVEEAEAP